MSSIAAQYGFASWRSIYGHPSNSGLRKARPNPNQLYPGDEVFVPELSMKSEACATDTRHHFKAKRPKTKLRIFLCDDHDEPMAHKRYIVRGEGIEFKGRTDSKGLVEQKIPARLTSSELLVWLDNEGGEPHLKIPLLLGHLDPIDTFSGVQARLHNLGYRCASSGGTTEVTLAAVRAFRRDHGLKDGDALDDAFRERLRLEHDGG